MYLLSGHICPIKNCTNKLENVRVWCNRTLSSNSQLLLSRTPFQTCSLTLSKTLRDTCSRRLVPPPSWKCLHLRGLSTPRESTIRGRLFQGYAEILCGIFLSPTEFFPNKDTIVALTLFPFPVISKDRVSAPNMFRLLISLMLIKVLIINLWSVCEFGSTISSCFSIS